MSNSKQQNQRSTYLEKQPQVNQQQFNYLFDRKQSEHLNAPYSFTSFNQQFKYQTIQYESQIMISDLIMIWESGLLNVMLSIQGYFLLQKLIEDFDQSLINNNKHSILLYCLVNKKENKIQITNNLNCQEIQPTLKKQFQNFIPRLSEFTNEAGKELNEVLDQALSIQKTLINKIKLNQNQDLINNIQTRFMIKQHLQNRNNDEKQKTITIFEEIKGLVGKIQSQYYFNYILDQLIEADFDTLKQIGHFLKNYKGQEHFDVKQSIISDQDLNNYYFSCLKFSEQKIKDKDILNEYQKQKNKIQYLQNLFEQNKQSLEAFTIASQHQTQIETDQLIARFKEEFIKQLRIKFWIFQNELIQQNQDQSLNNEIKAIYDKYSQAICLKISINHHFQNFIKTLINHDELKGVIGTMLDLKIESIHKYVKDNLEGYNLPKLNQKLNKLYKQNKSVYLEQLLKNPTLQNQQVDIIIDYCSRIRILIDNLRPTTIIDFTDQSQQKFLTKLMQLYFSNYQDLEYDEDFFLQSYQLTNKFCPLISISMSNQFQIYLENFQENKYKKSQLYQFNQTIINKIQNKNQVKLETLNYEKVKIYNFIEEPQNYDKLQCVFYENKLWDKFKNQLITEFNIQLDSQSKQMRQKQYNEEKKIQQQFFQQMQIPFELIEVLYQKSYDERKELEIIKQIIIRFEKVKKEDIDCLQELSFYIELENEVIDNRDNQIFEYLQSLGKRDYQSINELNEDITNLLKINRQQLFGNFYQIKNSIEQIHQEYLNQCNGILLQVPNFNKFKLEKAEQKLKIEDIDRKIIEFYENQLTQYLKDQLQTK